MRVRARTERNQQTRTYSRYIKSTGFLNRVRMFDSCRRHRLETATAAAFTLAARACRQVPMRLRLPAVYHDPLVQAEGSHRDASGPPAGARRLRSRTVPMAARGSRKFRAGKTASLRLADGAARGRC